ncbi:NAD-glutamate dehydrogenase [Hoeflea olei]|uniref:NAD-glutamate dehydrogenase n=1 Tax=Hoeflea olei TaxID=1480615 RepID=A0A1C1YV80_9HYPH|nr:NAD-glutamate dehydrogenase [Hoeflea olei]OCW57448.1 NAD-glutamate dehydrogenase [Hoeflea olei]
MTVANTGGTETLIAEAASIAARSKKPHVAPDVLFSRASIDDLQHFPAGTLADFAILAEAELRAWDGKAARVSLVDIDRATLSGADVTVLSITTLNKPFLYDSVMGEVTSQVRDILMAVHPIVVLAGKAPAILFSHGDGSDPSERVSYMQIHMPRLGPEATARLETQVRHVLNQIRAAVGDWKAMLAMIDHSAADLVALDVDKATEPARKEALAFIAWLRDNNFTFLGMREYVYSGEGESAQLSRASSDGLGILADPDVLVLRLGKDQVTTTPEILEFLQGPDFLIVTKANVRSVVHRRAYMDYIGIKRFNSKGQVIGELRVVGLFTSTAYTGSVTRIPLLRSKVEQVVSQFGYDPESHSGKLLLNTLEAYPRDDLFQIDAQLLARFCYQINELSDRPRVRVLPRIDHFDRFVSLIVYVPRDQYDSVARERIGAYFKTVYNGRVSAYYPAFPEGGVARVHFIIGRSEGKTPQVSQDQLERDVRAIVTRWEDQFRALGGSNAARMSVSPSYKERFRPEDALKDIGDILACTEPGAIRIAFYRNDASSDDRLALKIFHAGEPVSLSRRVPLLENLGFKVVSEQTHEILLDENTGTSGTVFLHDMEITHEDGRFIDLDSDGARLEEAFLSVWRGHTDNDGYNRLVTNAGLSVREATVLRAYARYLRQAGIAYSQEYIAHSLNRHAGIAARLFDLFRTRFDIALSTDARTETATRLMEDIESALAEVPSLDDDRIVRRYVNAIAATLRTNYFQTGADGAPRPAMAFKLDPKMLEGLPEPRPFREIFVYGSEVEGVHLRFGPVARGGLRWSDRAQDYRTEVLGLVKAQQVKNAVIVPVGAKGGFYPKKLPAEGGRDAVFEAGREAYKLFIRTLLSVTDNIVDDTVVPPADTVRHDGDDPYFVVAADKGTATFSDTANALSQERDFWLDDAFASGGSAGYDHKKMGITARGAWEAVKRHFREIDIDIQTTPFAVAGVGDMSGDVFGNGMLLSEKIRLRAAFDHRDIFIDPDPDCAESFAERRRLFELGRSSWQDYDRAKLSKGGMIIPRTLKSVDLSPEAAAAIGLDQHKATPQDIMSAILRMETDLLWFGGIGTYIKAAGESDADVGDRANDAIRVLAHDVRAKVIGEGANLGVTQRGRIAYALSGGRCNSDAIDNSAGVNSSDVEVNIKIALANAMREGRLTRDKRNVLLASMTDEVAALVLRNNYLQTLAISIAEAEGVAGVGELNRVMGNLESRGLLNRKVEYLPDDAAVAERIAADRALTRPEMGVLLSYAKLVLFDDIVSSDLPDEPYFDTTLRSYFPGKMQKPHAADIETHRLRREIIATLLGNDAINRGGPAFVIGLGDKSGATPSDVVKAFVLARDGLSLPALYARVDALDSKVPGAVQNRLYALIGHTLKEVTSWALKTGAAHGDLATAVKSMQAGIRKLSGRIAEAMPDFMQEEAEAIRADLVTHAVPDELAAEIAGLGGLALAPDICQVAATSNTDLDRATQAFFAVTGAFRVGRIVAAVERIQPSDHFEGLAVARGLDEIFEARRTIAATALDANPKAADPAGDWLETNASRIAHVRGQILTLTDSGELSVAKLTVAAGMLSDLARSLRT